MCIFDQVALISLLVPDTFHIHPSMNEGWINEKYVCLCMYVNPTMGGRGEQNERLRNPVPIHSACVTSWIQCYKQRLPRT